MTLLELSAQYEKSAQLLRVRLSELRRQKKTAEDRQELFWLERGWPCYRRCCGRRTSWPRSPRTIMKGDITAMKAIGYEDYQGPRLTRQQQIARMHRVIENELTEKQRRAVLGYYVDKKTMPELAREFGVCKSTVCRTIQRAEKRLRRCLRY